MNILELGNVGHFSKGYSRLGTPRILGGLILCG